MQGLLRADLKRSLTSFGAFYRYLIFLLAFVVLSAVGIPMLMQFYAETTGGAAADATYGSPLNFASVSMFMFGLTGFVASWCVASICWTDMRSGYIRTIISSCGKKSYFTEKLVFSLVICFLFIAITFIFGALVAGLFVGFKEVGSIFDLLIWIIVATLLTWSCATLTQAFLWLLKSNVIAYIVGFVLCTGMLSQVIGMLIGGIGVEVSEAWTEIKSWFPCDAFSTLGGPCVTPEGALNIDAMGWAHIIVPIVVLLVLSYFLVTKVIRKRDV